MPRPKRAKVAPSAPAPRVRKASQPSSVRKEVLVSKDGLDEQDGISDPEEGVVTSARHVKKDKGKGRAIGSLAMEESITVDTMMPGGPPISPSIPGEKTLLGDIDLGSSSSGIEFGRREGGANASSDRSLALSNFKRKPRRNSNLGGAARPRSSSVESNLAEDTGLAGVGRRNRSALGNNRRQRASSIMGRNAGRIRSSSPALPIEIGTPAVGSALRLGNFKRRARAPSILGTARKLQPQQALSNSEDEEDFDPEDESTPLNLSKTRVAHTSPTVSSSNPRKRKLSARQVPEPGSPSPSISGAVEADDQAGIRSGSILSDEESFPRVILGDAIQDETDAPVPSEEAPMPSIEASSISPENFSETMAPPRSSSESPGSPPLPQLNPRYQRAVSRGRRSLRNKTPLPIDRDSPPSSPPSLTHSPNLKPIQSAAKPRAKKLQPPASTFSTAQLQALLPRRRRRGATRDLFDIESSEEEVDVSGLASDDDELTHTSIRAPPRRLPAPLKKPNKSVAAAKAKAGGKATYSRVNAASDKENESHDPNDSLGPLPDNDENALEDSRALEERVGKKLKRVARKFQEVDAWEMDFEDNTASSSSPKDAR